MKLLMNLFYKCHANDLHFATNPEAGGFVNIHDYDRGRNYVEVASGYMNSPAIESAEEALTRMHLEVDEYLAEDLHDSEVEFEPEEASAIMTENERKGLRTSEERAMKESGHVEGDFS